MGSCWSCLYRDAIQDNHPTKFKVHTVLTSTHCFITRPNKKISVKRPWRDLSVWSLGLLLARADNSLVFPFVGFQFLIFWGKGWLSGEGY